MNTDTPETDESVQCRHCGSTKDPWFSRVVPMGLYCQDCGEECDYSPVWMPIQSAPRDGTEIIVYCPPAHGLNHMVSVCAWHEDAGFCCDLLREPTLWIYPPNSFIDLPAENDLTKLPKND